MQAGNLKRTHWERAVITSDRFGKSLQPMRIVAVQDCHFIPFQADNPWIVVAKVAGFDTAVYGLPQTSQPVLFEYSNGKALIATTKLSQFVTGRYAPHDAWPIIWDAILEWLTDGKPLPDQVPPRYIALNKPPGYLSSFKKGNERGELLSELIKLYDNAHAS